MQILQEGAFSADVRNAINTNFTNLGGTLGNTYLVALRSNTNFSYINDVYGNARNSDGSRMLYNDLQSAINACRTNRGDLIKVFAGTQSLSTAVLFNKAGITVEAVPIGYNPIYQGQRFMLYGPSTGPAAVISQPCVIKGFGFSGQYTGSGSHNVLVDATGGGFSGGFLAVKNCQFTTWGASPDYALLLNGCSQGLFLENSFDGAFDGFNVGAVGLSSSGGVQVWSTEFIANRFVSVGESKYAFVHVSGAVPNEVLYKGNILLGKTTATGGAPGRGKFLDNNEDTCLDVLVADNWIGLATDTGSYDDTVSNLNALGIRFAGNHYAE